MSDPKGGTPMDKYNAFVKKIADEEVKYEAKKNKETDTAKKQWDKIQKWKTDDLPALEKRKDVVVLSKTCLAHLDDWIKDNVYGRRKVLKTNPIQKWIECEDEALYIVNKALWTNYKKCKERKENEWIAWSKDSSNDVIKRLIDTKVCETIDTFPILNDEMNPDYYRQGQWYMWLEWDDYLEHDIIKVLVNSPGWMVKNKLQQAYNSLYNKYDWNMEYIEEEYAVEARQIFLQHVFDKQLTVMHNGTSIQLTDDEVIPYEKRVNIRTVKRDNEKIAKIPAKVMACRMHLQRNGYDQGLDLSDDIGANDDQEDQILYDED